MSRINGVWKFSVSELRRMKCLTRKEIADGRTYYLKAILKRKMVSFGINADFRFKASGTFYLERQKSIKANPNHGLDYGIRDMINIDRLFGTCELEYDFQVYSDSSRKMRRNSVKYSPSSYESKASESIFNRKLGAHCRPVLKLKFIWRVSIDQLLSGSVIQTEKEDLSEHLDTQWWFELHRKDTQWTLKCYVEDPTVKIWGRFRTNLDPSSYKFEHVFHCPNGTSSVSSFLAIDPGRLYVEKSGIFRLTLRMTIEKTESTAGADLQIMPLPVPRKMNLFGLSRNGGFEFIEEISEKDPCFMCFSLSVDETKKDGLLLPFSVGTIANVLNLIRFGGLIAGTPCDYIELFQIGKKFEIRAVEQYLGPIFKHMETVRLPVSTPNPVIAPATVKQEVTANL